MNTQCMFDYAKRVLESVSFDPELFYKELHKATQSLLPYQLEQLEKWVVSFIANKPELHESFALITR